MPYLSLQGKVYVATAVNGVPGVFRELGNVNGLSVSLETDVFEHKESSTGQRLTDLRLITSKKASLSFKLEDFTRQNLALGLHGVGAQIVGGNVTAEALPNPVAVGDFVRLQRQKVSSVVVTDSTATPKTLAQGTNYSVNSSDLGSLSFLNLTIGAPYVQPFRAAYSSATVDNINMFTQPLPEVWLRFEGINTADSNKGILVELYRAALSPASNLALITDELASLDLSGSVLYDSTKAADVTLGQFGRIVMV